jgi:hypothetical protein
MEKKIKELMSQAFDLYLGVPQKKGRVLQGYISLRCYAHLPKGKSLTPANAKASSIKQNFNKAMD